MVPQAIPVYVKFIKKIAWDKSSCVNIRYFIIGQLICISLAQFFHWIDLIALIEVY